ncbi:glycosyltransferase family 4 protein [Candidatus Parcubacteria bacterium]|nr:glycosyltransferase family 4 protein [Candidatus Parcubacteria bacterium]
MQWTLITHDYPPKRGGVARYLEALVKTCDCVSLEALDRLPNRIALLWFVYQCMKKSDGIITSHVLPIGTMCWIASKLTGKPYIVILHGMDFDLACRSMRKRWLLKKVLKNTQTIVTNSQALDREVSTFTGRMDVSVVYPTISDGFVEASHFINAKYQNKENIRLLTVGRLVERKGHMKVLDLVLADPTLFYTIVGDGPMKTAIKTFIKDHHLEDRVEVLTSVSDRKLPGIYAKSDIFVMPTSKTSQDREGFGIVYLEAQLFGLPVIATNQPGVDEAIIDQQTGYLIEDSSVALLGAVEQLKDLHDRTLMGKQGQEFVKAHFCREQQFLKFCKILACE